MNQQMKIRKEIAWIADGHDFYNQAKALGETAARVFGFEAPKPDEEP